MHLAVPWICLLLQQCLKGADPRTPPYSSLQPPSQLFFQLQPLESATQLSVITRTSHHFLSFTSYYQSTMNSQICQNYSTRVEAAVITWSTCICGPPIPTSLWGSVLTTDLWLWRVWPNSSANWPRRSMRTWKVSWKCKTSAVAAPSFWTCRNHLKMTGVKPRTLWKLPSS